MSSYISDCGVLGNPSGGTVDSSAGTTYGSVATFTCDLGYTMTGTATSTCQADESWDNLDPGCHINGTCSSISCLLNFKETKQKMNITKIQERCKLLPMSIC